MNTRLIILLLLLTVTAALPMRAHSHQDYTRHTFIDSNGSSMPYRLLEPERPLKRGGADADYPLVVCLHGAGERGRDNERQLSVGAALFSKPDNAERYPAYVVFPQCTAQSWTDDTVPDSFLPGAPLTPQSEQAGMVMKLINQLIHNYSIDPQRIYIIGISMGAICAYDLVCRYPDRFAAAVPICGAVNPDRLTVGVGKTAFMIFHGDRDSMVPVQASRTTFNTLAKAGTQAQYIEFANLGHDCWNQAFEHPTLLPWLFAQKISQ